MELVREFLWREWTDMGMYGWLQKNMPHFDPVNSPFGLVHDVMEHLDDGDDLSDEWQAFGAMLYIRAQGSYWEGNGNPHPPAYHMASDVVRFLCETRGGGKQADNLTERLDDEDAESIISAISAEVARQLPGEWESMHDEEIDAECMAGDIDNALAWMRTGYKRAVKVYDGFCPDELAWTFAEMERDLSKHEAFRQNGSMEDFAPGDVLRVSIDTDTLRYTIHLDREEDNYPEDEDTDD